MARCWTESALTEDARVPEPGGNSSRGSSRGVERVPGAQESWDHEQGQPRPDDPVRRCPDITRAQTILGWEPRVSLEEGMGETIRYFRNVLAATASADE